MGTLEGTFQVPRGGRSPAAGPFHFSRDFSQRNKRPSVAFLNSRTLLHQEELELQDADRKLLETQTTVAWGAQEEFGH